MYICASIHHFKKRKNILIIKDKKNFLDILGVSIFAFFLVLLDFSREDAAYLTRCVMIFEHFRSVCFFFLPILLDFVEKTQDT